ncbi:hypothetical protein BN871_BG_00040 [Paenibacillus sp. P22]|nr:hypothetical protein BN871_BG_00040 [Paenibacillus sp. P22]
MSIVPVWYSSCVVPPCLLLLALLDVVQMLLVGDGEQVTAAAVLLRHIIVVFVLLRMQRSFDGLQARTADRSRRQAVAPVRVVGALDLEILLVEPFLGLVQQVLHGGVDLQPHRLGQTVVDDAGDGSPLRVDDDLALDQRGDGKQLMQRHSPLLQRLVEVRQLGKLAIGLLHHAGEDILLGAALLELVRIREQIAFQTMADPGILRNRLDGFGVAPGTTGIGPFKEAVLVDDAFLRQLVRNLQQRIAFRNREPDDRFLHRGAAVQLLDDRFMLHARRELIGSSLEAAALFLEFQVIFENEGIPNNAFALQKVGHLKRRHAPGDLHLLHIARSRRPQAVPYISCDSCSRHEQQGKQRKYYPKRNPASRRPGRLPARHAAHFFVPHLYPCPPLRKCRRHSAFIGAFMTQPKGAVSAAPASTAIPRCPTLRKAGRHRIRPQAPTLRHPRSSPALEFHPRQARSGTSPLRPPCAGQEIGEPHSCGRRG